MGTCKILFHPFDKTVKVEAGESVIFAAMEAGIHINASCGGEGVCGKCRILVEKGTFEGGVSEKLDPEDVEKGVRLACLSKITGDAEVRIPVESSMDTSALKDYGRGRQTARIRTVDLEALKTDGAFDPPVEKEYLELPVPFAGDNVADLSRIINFVKFERRKYDLRVDLNLLRKVPDAVRENDFKVTITVAKPVNPKRRMRLVNIEPGDTRDRLYGIAFDIGTTTVCGELVDISDGAVLAAAADFNAQISYGEDVISRIIHAEKGGAEALQDAVLGTMNKMVNKLLKKAKIAREDVAAVSIAGNTTMTHLLLRINPRYIRRSPYIPPSMLLPTLKAGETGLDLENHTPVLIYPQISSYVGGDILAGVIASEMYLTEELTLFMDIGTNAEIVIGNRDWMTCAACSAGPALEGGGLEIRHARGKGGH